MRQERPIPAIPTPHPLPAAWQIKRLKWSVESTKNGIWGGDPTGGSGDIKCIRVADFDRVCMSVTDVPTTRNVSMSERDGRVVLPGDLLLEKSGGGEMQPVGAVAMYLESEPAVCSNFIARLVVARDADPRFFLYVHAALYSARITVRSIKQTSGIQNLDASAYFSELVGYPPISTQREIAAFLDRETVEADALVAKYERLVDLLEEKRVALITQAVTRGLAPDVPMKDSGVEWVGEMPICWSTEKLKRTARNGYKTFIDGDWIELPHITDGGIRLIQTGNIGVGAYREQGFRYISRESFNLLRCTEVQPGDLLVCRLAAPVGRACVAPDLGTPMVTSVDVCIIKTDAKGWDVRYLTHVLSSKPYLDFMEAVSRGGTRDRVSRSFLGNVRVPKPSLEEQRQIADSLDNSLTSYTAIASKARKAMSLLHERRAALITAAVTGQIDVANYRSSKRPIEVPA